MGASETRREKSQKRQLWGGKYNRWQHAPLHLNAMHKMICTVYNSIFFLRWKCREDESVRRRDHGINMQGHSDGGRGSQAMYSPVVQ